MCIISYFLHTPAHNTSITFKGVTKMVYMLLLAIATLTAILGYCKYRSIRRDVTLSGPSLREGYVMAEIDQSWIPCSWRSRITEEQRRGEACGFRNYKFYQCCYKKALGFQWVVVAGFDAEGKVVHAINLFRTVNSFRYVLQHLPLVGFLFIWLDSEVRHQFFSLLDGDIMVTGFFDDGTVTSCQRRDETHIDVFFQDTLSFEESVSVFRSELERIAAREELATMPIHSHRRIFKDYEEDMAEFKATAMVSYRETYG